MKKHIFAAIILSCMACLATAANWKKVGGSSGVTHYIDTTSITKSPFGRKAWSWTAYDSPQKSMYNAASMMTLDYYDCQNRTTAIVQGIVHEGAARSGKILRSWSEKQTEITMHDVIPDTTEETYLDVVCSIPMSTQ